MAFCFHHFGALYGIAFALWSHQDLPVHVRTGDHPLWTVSEIRAGDASVTLASNSVLSTIF